MSASDGSAGAYFGESLALDGSTLVVGAFGDDVGAASNAGAAYVFAVKKSDGNVCAGTTECTSGFCVDGVCCATACAGGSGDCTACSVALGAATDGTCGPTTGNPCAGGTCQSGTCQPSGTAGAGGAVSSGGSGGDAASQGGAPGGGTAGDSAAAGGSPAAGAPSGGQQGRAGSSDEGGCQCRAAGAGRDPLALRGLALALLGLAGMARRVKRSRQ